MHTQTQSSSSGCRGPVSVGELPGLLLFLLTISGEVMLAASVRWLLIYLGAAIGGAWVPFGLSAEVLAWSGALMPIVLSVAALLRPGRGWVWGRRLGARPPTEIERAKVEAALELLRAADPRLRAPAGVYVLDGPTLAAAVRSRAVVLTARLVESPLLAAVLAHELGHVNSLDGRLREALECLTLWGDPLGPPRDPRGREVRFEPDPEHRGALVWGAMRWSLRLAGGGEARMLLAWPWAGYWRRREYAADAYAARLGQGGELARFLTDQGLPFDAPQPGLFFRAAEHPPVALRLERLRRLEEGVRSE
jgi:Zn-dependent protease with chaperone function